MGKVLISGLGVGPVEKDKPERKYSRACYQFLDHQEVYETPFVAAALSKYLKVDRIIFIGTGKSMWEEVYRYFSSESGSHVDDNYWIQLAEMVDGFQVNETSIKEDFLCGVNEAIDAYLKYLHPGAAGGSQCYFIDYGLNNEELWNNFDTFMKIAGTLEYGDEIYLDITHSFRSIPLFMYLMLDFIRTLNNKKIKLSGIYYGMLEAKKDFGGIAPVVDLGPLFKISEWVKGVYDFVNYGNGYLIAELVDDQQIAEKIQNVSELININYLKDLKREVDSLDYHLKEKLPNMPVLNYIFPHFEDFTSRFRGISSNGEFQFQLARWYFENNRYSSGYVCLAESILTRILEIYRDAGAKINLTISERDIAKKLINGQFKFEVPGTSLRQLYDVFYDITGIRNRIAHAGFTGKSSFQEDIKKVPSHVKAVEKLAFSNKELYRLPERYPIKNWSK